MRKIKFTKMVATGNDFVVIHSKTRSSRPGLQDPVLVRKICDRKFGIGADGLLLLEKSKVADVRMRIFNADGSEAEMCGNGSRCAALYYALSTKRHTLRIETKAGIIDARVNKDKVRVRLTDPQSIRLNIPLSVSGRKLHVNFINTGVPHTVVFVEGLDKINVAGLGRQIRFHKHFAPAGTNVNFVEAEDSDTVRVRTYERGVEDETLACGTGSTASALVFALITDYRLPITDYGRINVITKSGEILKVYFDIIGGRIKNVRLEGRARIVYNGELICS